jgi:OOP family OmpA-OmpF porin
MRVSVRGVSAVGLTALLVGCGGAFEATSLLDQAKGTSPGGDAFTQALHGEYMALGQSEYDQYDFKDAMFYLNRVVQTSGGSAPAPTQISERNLPADYVGELTAARERLEAAFAAGAKTAMPAEAARAQSQFDCWMEQQEENFQPRDIAACKERFEAAMASLAPKASAETIVLSSDVLFDFDKAVIKPQFMPDLDAIAAELVADTNKRILVWGHTDSIGTEAYNQGLSERRANAVAAYLEGKGVTRDRMTIQGFGETQPVASNATREGRAQNRRVEIRQR